MGPCHRAALTYAIRPTQLMRLENRPSVYCRCRHKQRRRRRRRWWFEWRRLDRWVGRREHRQHGSHDVWRRARLPHIIFTASAHLAGAPERHLTSYLYWPPSLIASSSSAVAAGRETRYARITTEINCFSENVLDKIFVLPASQLRWNVFTKAF